jgi:8-oxo-dGTP diphosphatase
MKISRYIMAGVILNKENQVLLCKRSMRKQVAPGFWHMPGGGVENGESMQTCIERELAEELGVDTLEIGDQIVDSYEYTVGKGVHHVDFIPVSVKGKIELDDENDEYKWVSYANLENYVQGEKLDINQRIMKKAVEIGMISEI